MCRKSNYHLLSDYRKHSVKYLTFYRKYSKISMLCK
nr:MAG TPA: hypothetical protein [Bacteriophage sp.]